MLPVSRISALRAQPNPPCMGRTKVRLIAFLVTTKVSLRPLRGFAAEERASASSHYLFNPHTGRPQAEVCVA